MRQILTHKSRNVGDLIQLLRDRGTFSCPTLPHYRYDGTKSACAVLRKAGMLRRAGRCATSVQYAASELFKLWQLHHDLGLTDKGPVKWAKERKKYGH